MFRTIFDLNRLAETSRRAIAVTAAGSALFLAGCTQEKRAPETASSIPPASAPAAPAAQDNSDPALWVVKDADTTIYLFGTLHLLQPGLTWFDEGVKGAFDKSDTLVTEIPDIEDPNALVPLVMKYAASNDGKHLRDKLTADQRKLYEADLARYEADLAKSGISAAGLDKMDPWFVSLTLAMVHYAKAGMDPNSGSEETLFAAAKAAGKRTEALETPEQQFTWFDATPQSEQIKGLVDVVTKGDEIQSFISRMTTSWNKGDAEALADVMNENMDGSPETRRLLLTDRNARWADWIKKRLDTPGTVFVAVGAGHLAGQGSVQDQLATRKVKVERVNY